MGLLIGALVACNSKGADSSGAAPAAATEPPVFVTSLNLAKDYHANEVAADDKYKGKRLFVAGRVQSIDKDAFDSMNILMATENPLMSIVATMNDDAKSSVVLLSKGQIVTLDCHGGGMVIGSPVLRDCSVRPANAAPSAVPVSAPVKK